MTETAIAATDYATAWISTAERSWHPIARSADVKGGEVVAVQLLSRQLVVWRASSGELGLTHRACVHRGTDLAAGVVTDEGCLRCPYHGWQFRFDGRCVVMPQRGDRSGTPHGSGGVDSGARARRPRLGMFGGTVR